MKFSCTQENLNQCLLAVSNIANKNTNLPILNNILIQASATEIKFTATNLEIGVLYTVRGKIEEAGEITVPARVFAEYISLLDRERVDIYLENKDVEIKTENSITKIKGIEASEFPLMPTIEKNDPITCLAGDFIAAISQTIFAVSTNEVRPEMCGVFISTGADGQELVLAATDSYRLAERKVKLKKTNEKNNIGAGIIIPTRTLQELMRIMTTIKRGGFETADEMILEIYLSDGQILFVCQNVELLSRLVDGKYPDYTQIIPTAAKTECVVNTNDLIKAVKTASLFTRNEINDISLKFSVATKELAVSSINSQVGENLTRISANISGNENDIVLNYRYFLDALNNMDSDEVIIAATDNNVPCVVKPVLASPTAKRNYLCLVMPIKQ